MIQRITEWIGKIRGDDDVAPGRKPGILPRVETLAISNAKSLR